MQFCVFFNLFGLRKTQLGVLAISCVIFFGHLISDRTFAAKNPATESPSSDARPNIVLINLDDADDDLFADDLLKSYLPHFGELAQQGMRFTNCHVTTPICGPSRTCLLLGQYAHRTGVRTNTVDGALNNGFSGGYEVFIANRAPRDHLGGWLQDAGYRTMLVGKYLHGRMNAQQVQGWNDLHISFGSLYFGTSHYSTRYPIGERRRAADATAYRTHQESEAVIAFINAHAARRRTEKTQQPFFLYLNPVAPHQPAIGTKMLTDELEPLGKEIRLAETPDFNEADMSDKPLHLRVPRLSAADIAAMNDSHRKRALSLIPIDELLKQLNETLRVNGMADNTYVFLTSDHGYVLGHHRMLGKQLPYQRCTHVPLLVRGPGVVAGRSAKQLVSNIDFAPTFLTLAGVTQAQLTSHHFDGKPLTHLLHPLDSEERQYGHHKLLIENWESKGPMTQLVTAAYSSRRTENSIYTEWSNGAREYYELTDDPYQLRNIFESLPHNMQETLSVELHTIKSGTLPPLVTIATEGTISRQPVLRGYAEDTDWLTNVDVQIKNETTGQYFNGSEWQNESKSLTAKLLNPNGLITEWEFQADFRGIADAGEISLTATSSNGNANSKIVGRKFSVDAGEPTTMLKLPEEDSTVESPVMLFGFCEDNITVTGIKLVLKNVTENTYWNGAEWVSQPATFLRPLRNHERWHVNVPVPAGEYEASAAAFDAAGNIDSTPSVKHFFVK